MMKSVRTALAGFALLLLLSSWSHAQTHYVVSNLGGLGEPGVFALGINNSGDVAGWCYTLPINTPHAFLRSGGTMTDLGVLGGVPTATDSEAYGLNDNGRVVGWSWDANGNTRAFLYNGTSMQDLGTLGGSHVTAYAINNAGQIVGTSSTTNDTYPPYHAFLYSNGSMQDLGTFGGSGSSAAAISQNGQIAGTVSYSTPSYYSHAVLYSSGTVHDLGVLGTGTYSWPSGVNNSGQVVGTSYIDSSGTYHAFLYTGGSMHDLALAGSTYSSANAINNGGQVVGNYYAPWITDGSTYGHAFISDGGGAMTDLNNLINPASGLILEMGTSINDQGWIVGRAHRAGDPYKYSIGFLAKPSLAGDVNLDGAVNMSDLSVVLTNFDKSGMTWTQGDLNGDGTVAMDDLTKVLAQFDNTIAASAGPTAAAVPEPASLLLLGAAMVALWPRGAFTPLFRRRRY
jgi:probable HAF family extracellular repeat protein